VFPALVHWLVFRLAMDDSLQELLSEQDRLKKSLAATRKEIKGEQQKAKDKAKSVRKQWELTPWLKKVIMIIYMLADLRAAPATKYLHITAQRRRWPTKSDEELDRLVEDLFLEVDVGLLLHMSDLEAPEDPAAAKEALKYVEQWRALEHVKDLNQRLGIAPSTELVLQKLEENRLKIPEPSRPSSLGVSAEGKARMWARRWRQRWGARHGRLQIQDQVPLAEMQSKAGFFESSWVLFFCFLGPENGTHFAPRFRASKWHRLGGFHKKTNENIQGRPILVPGIWAQNVSHFPAPESTQSGPSSVAVVQLLCSPSTCWKGSASHQHG
jgi:hypothetical protein